MWLLPLFYLRQGQNPYASFPFYGFGFNCFKIYQCRIYKCIDQKAKHKSVQQHLRQVAIDILSDYLNKKPPPKTAGGTTKNRSLKAFLNRDGLIPDV